MATSIRKAQVIACCQLCDNSNPLKWKCLNCTINLCDECRTCHERIPATRMHQVVGISEENTTGSHLQLNTNGGKCALHDETITLFCTSCNEFVCNGCVTEDHNSHTFEKNEIVHKRLKDDCSNTISLIKDKKRPEAQSRLANLRLLRQDLVSQCNSIKDKVIEREKALKSAIEEKRAFLISKIETISKDKLDTMKSMEDVLKEKLERLDIQESSLESLINNVNPQTIMSLLNDIKGNFDDTVIPTIENTSVTFYPGKMKEKYLNGIFGFVSCSSGVKGTGPGKYVLEIKAVVKTSIKFNILCPINENLVWIGSRDFKGMTLIMLTNPDLPVRSLSLQPRSFTVTTDGTLVVSDKEDNCVKAIDSNAEVRLLKNFHPLEPISVQRVKNDFILACVVDRKFVEVNKKSVRKVVKLDMSGNVVYELEKDKKGNKLFILPTRSLFNSSTGEIIVNDRTSQNSSRVVSVSKDGKINFIYTGSDEKREFRVRGFDMVNSGLLIIVEYANENIHLLNATGQCLSLFLVGGTELALPKTLAWVGNETLIVGTETLEKRKNKICIVKLKD